MALANGTRVGIYEVTAKIGEGGMGEVYQARDTTLERDVALKVLPETFTTDPDRLARFQREAKVLASLNHPNIGAIHGLETSENTQALVLELIEGPTLAERIAKGPIPVDEALEIATQIAAALEAAHEQGIIHRDLKPANVKVKTDGTVKVLDFGLAKAVASDARGASPTTSATMSLTTSGTQMGMVIGTAAYMAPEQAKGQPVDRRADIWAFGVVLFEMLSGSKCFPGSDVSDTLATVLKSDPTWQSLPDEVPARVRQLLHTCLDKDPKQRIHDVADVRLAMGGAFESTVMPSPDTSASLNSTIWKRPTTWLGVSALGVVLVVAVIALSRPPAVELPITRFVETPAGRITTREQRRAVAISPDGSYLAYTANNELYLRRLDQPEAEAIPGTENAAAPFFSPDGQWIGFFTPSEMKKVALTGGAPLTVCEVTNGLDGSWSESDMIVFGVVGPTDLFQVSAQGGTPEPLTTRENPTADHDFPDFLPDGDVMLFSVARDGFNFDDGLIVAESLSTGERRVVIDGGFYPRWLPSGHLIFARGGGLFVVPFNPDTLEVQGNPVEIVSNVMQSPGGAAYSTSKEGSLVYLSGGLASPLPEVAAVSIARDGTETMLPVATGGFASGQISPDGTRMAVARTTGVEDAELWISDVTRGTLSRFTTSPGLDTMPRWTPDGASLVFASDRSGEWGLYQQSVDGRGEAEQLLEIAEAVRVGPDSWTPDGANLVFSYQRLDGSSDVGILPIGNGGEWSPLLNTPADETHSDISPDGQWIAYASNETGITEVYVERFPGLGLKTQISTGGGQSPQWTPGGDEIIYRTLNAGAFMAVQIGSESTLTVGTPAVITDNYYALTSSYAFGFRMYDIFPDGERFLAFRETQDENRLIRVALNAFRDLN